jgi:protein SCO1/2
MAACCVGVWACGGSEPAKTTETSAPPPSASSEAKPGEKRYDLKGKVISIDKPAKKVTIDHENIEGFMMAMTMPYSVKDETELDKIAPGDAVTAKVVSSGSDYWLEDLQVVK